MLVCAIKISICINTSLDAEIGHFVQVFSNLKIILRELKVIFDHLPTKRNIVDT